MHEPVFLTYVDLDRLIEQCSLSAMQRGIVKTLMDGYSIVDCAEMLGCAAQSISTQLQRAVGKITAQNTKNWEVVYGEK